jgi:hypothetical protein
MQTEEAKAAHSAEEGERLSQKAPAEAKFEKSMIKTLDK